MHVPALLKMFLSAGVFVACNPEDQIELQKQTAIAEIRQMLELADSCVKKQEATGWCEEVAVSFSPKPASEGSVGQRVLVIDYGMTLPAYTRYRTRVIDFVLADSTGKYQTTREILGVPKWSYEILWNILGTRYDHLPAMAFNDLHHPHLNWMTPYYKPGHGDLIFGTLADLNPGAEFVVAQIYCLPEELCRPETDVFASEVIKNYITNVSNSLIEIIDKHDIGYINMSFGETLRSLRKSWNIKCNGRAPDESKIRLVYSLLKRHFYQPLSSLPHVVTIQAGAEEPIESAVGNIDCEKYDGRIRVGYISEIESSLPPRGGWVERHLPDELRENIQCLDMLINSGVENNWPYNEGPYPMFLTSRGTSASSPRAAMATSWAAPLALSYLIYLGRIHPDKDVKALLFEAANSEGKIMIDPFRHKQFMVFHAGL